MQTDGDNEHWCERLYEAEAARLLLYGRALGLSLAEAEDVLHDTFRALMGRGEAPEEPRAYLLRSFRNRTLNHRRGLWRRVLRELEARRWFEPAADHSPEERAAMRLLTRLPVEQREAIVLKVWHGLTFEAIGGLQGISPNTAAGRYRYGLQKLRAAMKGNDHVELESLGESLGIMDSPGAITGGARSPLS